VAVLGAIDDDAFRAVARDGIASFEAVGLQFHRGFP
jgi:hypothetical protein